MALVMFFSPKYKRLSTTRPSKPDSEVLFLQDLPSEDQDTDEEQVDTKGNGRMALTIFPGLFHFPAPMDIIEYYEGKIIRFIYDRVEVLDRWLQPVIAIDEGEIDG